MRLWIGLAVLSLGLLWAFVAFPYLPMVDLPQHAAQISAWIRLDDPGSDAAHRFTLNLRTPYLTAYVLARVAAGWIGVVPALKGVVWLSIVAHAAAFGHLVRRLGHPLWLALFGIPLAVGYAFFFGFVSYLAALPFVLLSISAALAHRDEPSLWHGASLSAFLCLTVLTHGFAFELAVLMVSPLLLGGRGSLKRRFAPILIAGMFVALWLLPGPALDSIGATVWEPRVVELLHLPALLFASSSADHAAWALGVGTLALIALAVGEPAASRERLVPLALLVAGFCLFPLSLRGFGPWHPRFATLLIPAILLGFEPSRVSPRGLEALTFLLCFAWLAAFSLRLAAFSREMQPLRDFVASAPSGLRVRPIVFERNSLAFPGLPVMLHSSAYYAAEKGGEQGYSFAMYPTSVIRYAPGVPVAMGGGAEWHPEWFSPANELDRYDCFLVRSNDDPGLGLFGNRRSAVTLAFHEGRLWAYETRPAASRVDRLDSSGVAGMTP